VVQSVCLFPSISGSSSAIVVLHPGRSVAMVMGDFGGTCEITRKPISWFYDVAKQNLRAFRDGRNSVVIDGPVGREARAVWTFVFAEACRGFCLGLVITHQWS
jgi:hypothetical protein